MGVLTEEEFRLVCDVYKKAKNVFYSFTRAKYDPNSLIDPLTGNFGSRVRFSFLCEAYDVIKNSPSGDLIPIRELPFWYINSLTANAYQNGREQYEGCCRHFPPFHSSAIELARAEFFMFEQNFEEAFYAVASKEEENNGTIARHIKEPFDIDDDDKIRFMTSVIETFSQWEKNRGQKGRLPLEHIRNLLSVEESLVCREHSEFFRKLIAEQDTERQAKEDEAFRKWGLTLDRKKKELTRVDKLITVYLSPNEIKYFTDSAQNVFPDFERLEIKKESYETAVSKLRAKLSPLGITISYGDYRLEKTR